MGSWVNDIFDNDFLGTKRLKNCVSNPMSISDGYACGSVTEEYHNFGNDLFNTAINMKIIMTLIDSMSISTTDARKRQMEKKRVKNKKKSAIKESKNSINFKLIAVMLPAITNNAFFEICFLI
jgi:hypothetical protein